MFIFDMNLKHNMMITIFVLYKNNLPKGLVKKVDDIKNIWWDYCIETEVPEWDWNNGKVRIDTIQNYL